jgi:hypothetical protein
MGLGVKILKTQGAPNTDGGLILRFSRISYEKERGEEVCADPSHSIRNDWLRLDP